jgi:hypothetical protein
VPSLTAKLDAFRFLLARLDAELEKNKVLPQHEWWRKNYYTQPYLSDAPDEYVGDRFIDVMNNNTTLTETGQIAPLMGPQSEYFTSRFTHLIEEMNYRPGLLQRTDLRSKFALKPTFPERPAGFKILGARAIPKSPMLVKLGKAKYLREMFSKGSIRIAPASSYSDPSLNAAIQDDELKQKAMLGLGSLALNVLRRDSAGKQIVLRTYTGSVGITVSTPKDFYVSCFAAAYDYRLVDDFESDAMIVVTNRARFLDRLRRKVQHLLPDWQFEARDVDYFDPFFVHPKNLGTGFAKHFRYSYQNEFRAAWLPPKSYAPSPLTALTVSIGAMRDIAAFFTLPTR